MDPADSRGSSRVAQAFKGSIIAILGREVGAAAALTVNLLL